jgi:ankyrin repeat protein
LCSCVCRDPILKVTWIVKQRPAQGILLAARQFKDEDMMMKLMREPGVDPAAGDKAGRQPLHYAALHGLSNPARALLHEPAVRTNAEDR